MPLWQLFGGDCNTITTDITIPIGSAEEMAATAQQYVHAGFTALKLKAGNDELADIAAIKAVSAAVGPNVSIKVDANKLGPPPKPAASWLNCNFPTSSPSNNDYRIGN